MEKGVIYQRITHLMKVKNIKNDTDLSVLMGVSKQSISNLKTQKDVRSSFLLRLITAIPDCNIEYIISGKGTIVKEPERCYEEMQKLTERNMLLQERVELYKEKIDFYETKTDDAEKRRTTA